jgi:hypothetical protein
MLSYKDWSVFAHRKGGDRGAAKCNSSCLNRWRPSCLSRHSNHSNLSGVSPGERSPFEGSCCGSSYNNVSSETSVEVSKYRVVLLGDAGVGKSALVSQFMTSEYMNTYDASLGKDACNCAWMYRAKVGLSIITVCSVLWSGRQQFNYRCLLGCCRM